jgi:tetratricopeptide (TPR) repeat protein
LAYFQNGETEKAAGSVQKAIALKPDLPAAQYNLGRILQALGRHDEAIAAYLTGLTLRPDDFEAHNNIGTILRTLKRYDDAIAHYKRALMLRPDYVEAYLNLGNALQLSGRLGGAINNYQKAIALHPNLAEAHMNLGTALHLAGRDEEACRRHTAALSLKPDLAEAHYRLGDALQALNRPQVAARHYEQALALQPDLAPAHLGLGNALHALNRFAEAIAEHEKALALDPNLAEAHINIAMSLQALNRLEEAVSHVEEAIRWCQNSLAIQPDDAEAHHNIGIALHVLDRRQQAIQQYEKAIALAPNWAEPKMNLGILHLANGCFVQGFELYEHRWAASGGPTIRSYTQPRWNGQKVDGALLVWGVQGLGDQILHASMIPELGEFAQSVIVEIEPRLVPLFARSFPSVRVVGLAPELYAGEIEAHEPLDSLGRHLRTGWEDFPKRPEGYLLADRARAAELRQRLTRGADIVIGLSWLSTNPQLGALKSAQLRDFESVLRQPGCCFVDLQYGDTHAERELVERELGIRVERFDDIDNTNDIDGLAALISACDLVVTVSNTTAHLAGALGKPTWVMVPYGYARFWYWFMQREDTPFYPRVHLKRQSAGQSFANLAASVTEDVFSFLRTARGIVNAS